MARRFENLEPAPLFGTYTDPFADRRGTGPVRPEQPLDAAKPDFFRKFDPGTLYAAWLGHSSVFLVMGGKTILIDPVFSRFVSPIPFAGPKRFPGHSLRLIDLPIIDLAIITHNHYDHLDGATIRAMDRRIRQYAVPLGVGRNLRSFGVRRKKITELDWYQEHTMDDLTIACTPSRHNSARSLLDRNHTLWGSFVLKNKDFTVFDTGDGSFGSHFEEIHRRYGDADLAIMECGQYNVRWHSAHMFPEESAEAARILGARLAVPVHWGAYVLSDHPWDDPPKRFARRAQELGVPFRIPTLNELITIEARK